MKEKDNREVWESIFQHHEWGKYPPIPLVRFIAKTFYKFNRRNELKFLEIGSGTGANLWYLAREGFKVSGIDFSENAIKRLIERFKNENLEDKIEYLICGDYIEAIDNLNDAQFDCILDIESLVCNPYDKAKSIIKKCYDKLKPGGYLFSMHFEVGSWGHSSATYDENLKMYIVNEGPLKNTGYIRFLDISEIDDLYLQAGKFELQFIHRDSYYYSDDTKLPNDSRVMKELIICLKKMA